MKLARGCWHERLLCLLLLTQLAGGAESVAVRGRTMGTTWVAKWPRSATVDTNEVQSAISAQLQKIEEQFSTYRQDSELSRFNAQVATNWIPVSPELARVGAVARQVSELTQGTFDVTVDPVVRAYGFGPAEPKLPLTEARQRVGWQHFEVRREPPAWRKADARISVDFSGIAKGFAADFVSTWLLRRGVTNHLVQIGGEVRASGSSGDGTGWRVAVQRPELEGLAIELAFQLRSASLSTSGNYHNTRVIEGVRQGHIIDPRTGAPVGGPLMGVSVVHASGTAADALAKGFFVLGPVEGMKLAEKEHVAVLYLINDGKAIQRVMSSGFQKLLAVDPGAHP